jgi:tRNA (mo5U34)-methyltransferase
MPAIPTALDRTAERIRALEPWFHNLHLPDGSQTAPHHPLGDFPSCKWESIRPCFERDLRDATVLDIGCNAGFYTIEFARRGAQVTGIDMNEHYLTQAQWAVDTCGLSDRVNLQRMQVYELAGMSTRFDIVLFLGVLYHLRYPLLGFDIVARRTRGQLVLQSLTMPGDSVYPAVLDCPLIEREHMLDPGWPKMAFIEHRLANDPTNWWAPNRACLEALARSCGLRVLARPGDEMLLCEPDPQNPSCIATWNRAEFQAATTCGCASGEAQ